MTDMDVGFMNKPCGLLIIGALLTGCFNDGDGSSESDLIGEARLACDLTNSTITFKDQDSQPNSFGGDIVMTAPDLSCNAKSFVAQWSVDGNAQESNTERSHFSFSAISIQSDKITLTIPSGTAIPAKVSEFLITPKLNTQLGQPTKVLVHDVLGFVEIHGPGGNRKNHWNYGDDRPALLLPVERRGSVDYCRFDNGNVLIHDANYEEDPTNGKVAPDDIQFPAYEFDCTDSKENVHRKVMSVEDGEVGVHTYSMINDAYYYGDFAFTMFEKYFQTRPLEKLRIRAHYGPQFSLHYIAHWDGAYANLNDVYYHAYGTATLDVVAHEAAHGVLQNLTALKHASEVEYKIDGRTLHEAYADMATVAAHYEMYGELNWINGDENYSSLKRNLDRIETESGAILSYLDYGDAGPDPYKRMGMLTYPFYLLTQKWGIEKTFRLFTDAAKSCWEANSTLLQAATCVKVRSDINDFETQDVIDAFRTVKIKLANEDTFAHFKVDARKLNVEFKDNSQSDRTIVEYRWDFGDGETSSDSSPSHIYSGAGDYTVNLEVEDHIGVIDHYSRTFRFTDQYCEIRDTPSDWAFTSVHINGVDLGFTPDKSDYTSTIIDVNAGENFEIKIDGNILNPEKKSTTWFGWVDLNDDGVFAGVDYNDNDKSEQRLRESQDNGEFGLDKIMDIPEQYRGKTLFMRISSDTNSACYGDVGSTFDVRIKVN